MYFYNRPCKLRCTELRGEKLTTVLLLLNTIDVVKVIQRRDVTIMKKCVFNYVSKDSLEKQLRRCWLNFFGHQSETMCTNVVLWWKWKALKLEILSAVKLPLKIPLSFTCYTTGLTNVASKSTWCWRDPSNRSKTF